MAMWISCGQKWQLQSSWHHGGYGRPLLKWQSAGHFGDSETWVYDLCEPSHAETGVPSLQQCNLTSLCNPACPVNRTSINGSFFYNKRLCHLSDVSSSSSICIVCLSDSHVFPLPHCQNFVAVLCSLSSPSLILPSVLSLSLLFIIYLFFLFFIFLFSFSSKFWLSLWRTLVWLQTRLSHLVPHPLFFSFLFSSGLCKSNQASAFHLLPPLVVAVIHVSLRNHLTHVFVVQI